MRVRWLFYSSGGLSMHPVGGEVSVLTSKRINVLCSVSSMEDDYND